MAGLIEKAKNYVAEKLGEIKKPEAEVTDVDFKSLSLNSLTLNAKISVTNPYCTPIPIMDITFLLKSAGREIVSGTIPDPGNLVASGVTLLEVPVKIPHSILISLARDIGRDWDIDYELEIGLIVDLPLIGNITIPLTTSGEMKLPTISDFFGGGGGGSKDDDDDKEEKKKKEKKDEK